MSARSAIEWTDATWNPVTGCSVVSPGCTNCYAMKLAGTRLRHHPSRRGLTQPSKAGPVWTGEVRLNAHWLDQPLQWRQPRRIFVCAHGDLFHEAVPDAWIDRVFAVMALAPQHTFQVLTKRAERMREYMTAAGPRVLKLQVTAHPASYHELHTGDRPAWPLPNVWLGVSAEDQTRADERIPHLLATPAAVRFVSLEPLLGPIDILPHLFIYTHEDNARLDSDEDLHASPLPWRDPATTPAADICSPRLDWVIAGGESGHGARPSHPDWFRSLRDQCAAAEVPFFFQQWGEHLPVGQVLPGRGKVHGATAVKPGRMKLHYRGSPRQAPKHAFAERGVGFTSTADGQLIFRVGKKAAGALLDGKLHREVPS